MLVGVGERGGGVIGNRGGRNQIFSSWEWPELPRNMLFG